MVNFIGTLGYSIILPFLVFLVNDFGGNEFIYGLVGAVYPAFQFFGAPLMGKWSDTYGRKRILFLSQLGTLIAWFIFMIALFAPKTILAQYEASALGSFTLTIPLLILVFARAMDGITGGNVSVANAYLSDVSTEETRKTNFGKMAMSSSLGFILGPSIAGVLGSTKYEEVLPVGAAILISMVALYVIWFRLPETKANLVKPSLKQFKLRKLFATEQKDCYEVDDCPDKGLKSVLKVKNIPFMLVIYFLTFLGFSFFYVSFPMHALNTLEWTAFELGIFFSIMSGLMILVQGPVLSLVSKKTSEETLISIGSILLVINFLLIGSTNIFITYLSLIFFAFGNGLMWPSFLSLVAKYAGSEQQGAVQGVANSAGSLASIFGLILGGWLYGAVGNITFYIAATLLLIIFMLSFRLFKLKKAKV
ncbi:MFS transporter [Roseivirga sp.]|uniref:MFS transporter n=1 Tax=Roseivirga sp. TaxID=1964215 RepID=UPI003BA9E72B